MKRFGGLYLSPLHPWMAGLFSKGHLVDLVPGELVDPGEDLDLGLLREGDQLHVDVVQPVLERGALSSRTGGDQGQGGDLDGGRSVNPGIGKGRAISRDYVNGSNGTREPHQAD